VSQCLIPRAYCALFYFFAFFLVLYTYMGQARAQTRGSICGGLSNEPIAHYFGGVCYINGAGTRSDPRQRLRGRSTEPIAHYCFLCVCYIYIYGQARAQTRGSVCGGGLLSLLRGGWKRWRGSSAVALTGLLTLPLLRLPLLRPPLLSLKEVEGIECCGPYRSINSIEP
jgi:hypothetical protein